MQKYKIDINHIKFLYNTLLTYYPENIEEISYIEFLLDRLNNNFKHHDLKNPIESLKNDVLDYDYYNQYYPYIRKMTKKLMTVYDIYEPNYKILNLSDNDAITIAGDFYLTLDSFFYKKFDYIYKDLENHLEFIKPNKNTDGEIHFFESFNEAFIYVPNFNNFMKVSVLIHELEHVIDSLSNKNFYKQYLIRESTTTFMEMISCNYLQKVLNLKNDGDVRNFNIYALTRMQTDDVYNKTQILGFINKYNYLNDKELIELLYKHFSKEKIEYLSKYSFREDYYYQISYVIAIELYYIYKYDKQKSLNIIKDIITNGTDNNIINLLNKYNINLTKHILDYEDELCLKLNL